MSEGTENARLTWLTLGSASGLLGVSESTIRRWADAGEIRSYRTSGGHRRVAEEDLRHIVSGAAGTSAGSSDRISGIALTRVKRRLARGRQRSSVPALDDLNPAVRDHLRLIGRRLVDLFARFVASGTKGDRFADDARTIGHEYGRTLVGSGVRLTTAIATFNALRLSLEETAGQIASEAGLSADDAVDAIERVLRLTDVVLEGLAEIYESGTGTPAP